jgi:hypothetical protein
MGTEAVWYSSDAQVPANRITCVSGCSDTDAVHDLCCAAGETTATGPGPALPAKLVRERDVSPLVSLVGVEWQADKQAGVAEKLASTDTDLHTSGAATE